MNPMQRSKKVIVEYTSEITDNVQYMIFQAFSSKGVTPYILETSYNTKLKLGETTCKFRGKDTLPSESDLVALLSGVKIKKIEMGEL